MKENVPKHLKFLCFEQFPPASSKCEGCWLIYAASILSPCLYSSDQFQPVLTPYVTRCLHCEISLIIIGSVISLKAQSRLLTPDQHMAPSAHSLPREPALSDSENIVKDYLLIEKKSETVEQYIGGEMFINHEHDGVARQPKKNVFTENNNFVVFDTNGEWSAVFPMLVLTNKLFVCFPFFDLEYG